jgi:hypothetical protein
MTIDDETPGCGTCLAGGVPADQPPCVPCAAWLAEAALRLREWLGLLERFDAFCARRDAAHSFPGSTTTPS